jgi:hypothetical protein
LLGALVCGAALAGEYCAPLMSAAPAIDGQVGAQEWSGAVRVDGFGWQGALERRRCTGYVGATDAHLYCAVVSQLPVEGEILADVDRDSENLVFDDAVEVWIEPTFGQESGMRFQMLANSRDHAWYKMHRYGNVPENPGWRGDWALKSGMHDGYWHLEVAVPLDSVAPGRKATDGAWGVNLCRDWKQEWAWASLGMADYKPADRFRFVTQGAPAVRSEERGDPFVGEVHAALVLTNPGAAPIGVSAELRLQRDVMPELKEARSITLAPGATEEVVLQVSDRATRKYQLSTQVVSADGATTYLSRTVGWSQGEPWTWTARKRVIPPLDFRFAYYPYLNRMRILADAANLPREATLESLTATVRSRDGAEVKSVRFDALQDGKQELSFDLPPLQGPYEIALRGTGPGVPADEVVKPFERTVYEWEHGDLGKSTRVYPPFTPLEVQGRRVSTVLREHEMTDAGLWGQVTATGQDLLAASMRWEGSDGAPLGSESGVGLRFTARAGHSAAARARIAGGPLKAEAACTWDYDGTMRVDLTLAPSDGREVERLDLVIPLKAEAATYYHAMGDGIRNTLYARVPPGEGVVWDSRAVASNDLPRNFCTYLYVGTPARGLCWFAENDRNWGWDPATPNVEMAREGDQLLVRVHLINRPEVIREARTLTFGLLAAPVKPRLSADWRHKYRRDRYSLLGTDINWFALGDCGSVYPAGKDMHLWEMLKRGNTEQLSDAEVEQCLADSQHYVEPYGPDRIATWAAHVRHNLRSRFGTKMVFYYNRASYQLADEFETFKDEWGLTDYRTIDKGNGIWEIKIVPSESYIDHALYWYGKSFDVGGNQGVYWDNWFFVGDYNTQMTGAYKRPDGTVVPSTGLWGLRELCKRTFQYMNERGMPPITMPHMTSTQILPLHSFATVQYDWEWKYSEGDVQYRFPREYILMVSNGELAGTWPVLLNDHGPQAEDPWISRTFAAVCMLHELDCPYAGWSPAGQAQLALLKPVDDILAQPGVEAFRYWDERPQPVVTGDPDLPTIVYSVKGREAVFAVVSYAETDKEAKVAVDPAALGFDRGYVLSDAETGQELPVAGNTVTFPLKKHDIRVCKVVAR